MTLRRRRLPPPSVLAETLPAMPRLAAVVPPPTSATINADVVEPDVSSSSIPVPVVLSRAVTDSRVPPPSVAVLIAVRTSSSDSAWERSSVAVRPVRSVTLMEPGTEIPSPPRRLRSKTEFSPAPSRLPVSTLPDAVVPSPNTSSAFEPFWFSATSDEGPPPPCCRSAPNGHWSRTR